MTDEEINAAALAAYLAYGRACGELRDASGFEHESEYWKAAVQAAFPILQTDSQKRQELHESASTYARNVFDRHGIDGLVREIERVMRKLDAAYAAYHDGSTRQLLKISDTNLLKTRGVKARVAVQIKRQDATSLALELDGLQSRINEAQNQIDRCSRASIMLFVDEDKWDKYPSYQAYLESFRVQAG